MRPRLIHPVAVEITQIDVAATTLDATWREPVGGAVWRPPVALLAQVAHARADRLRMEPTGDRPQADGHLTFLAADLTTAGVTLKKGDRITKVAGAVRDWQIVEVRPVGTYDGSNWLVQTDYVAKVEP
jgi:hypothetical protein